MTSPSILEELRRVRHEISNEIGHDPKRLLEYYASLQESVRFRTINLADQGPYGRTKHAIAANDPSATDSDSSPRLGELHHSSENVKR